MQGQDEILRVLETLKPEYASGELTKNREVFEKRLAKAFKGSTQKFERATQEGAICQRLTRRAGRDSRHLHRQQRRARTQTRTYATARTSRFPEGLALPLPLTYGKACGQQRACRTRKRPLPNLLRARSAALPPGRLDRTSARPKWVMRFPLTGTFTSMSRRAP